MKNRILIFPLCIILCYCNSAPKEKLSQDVQNMIAGKCPDNGKKELMIYYFDGECSFCLSKMSATEHKYSDKKNIACIFIARTTDAALLKYSLKEMKIKSCVIFEENEAYKPYLTYGVVTHVNEKKEIVSRMTD